MAEPKTTVTIRMPPELYTLLVKEAEKQGVSLNAFIIDKLKRGKYENLHIHSRK